MSIADVFGKAKAENRSLLVGCMPAGFPTVNASIASMVAMAEAGCDVIEVELPYSDPVMDGPVIQKASDIALANGVRTRDTLRIIETIAGTGVPVVLMTYWNPIEKYGVRRLRPRPRRGRRHRHDHTGPDPGRGRRVDRRLRRARHRPDVPGVAVVDRRADRDDGRRTAAGSSTPPR